MGDTSDAQPDVQRGVQREPSGDDGQGTDRDERGRFTTGNRAALVTGARSQAFWREHEQACDELVHAILQDAGHDPSDAPKTLLTVAQGLAQSVLVRDSAYHHVAQSGGPLTSSGRARRAFQVWMAATDRVEKHARLLGLSRVAKDLTVVSAEQWIAAQQEGS